MRRTLRHGLFLLPLALLACRGRTEPSPAEDGEVIAVGTTEDAGADRTRLATFGGGCFWCTEAIFQRVRGVVSVAPGYAGGRTEEPTYEQVCSGTTGHAEVIQVRFDPDEVAYEDLLRVFFLTHDPTTKDRQGHDVGTQYRSIVLAHDAAQVAAAESVKRELEASEAFGAPVVTEIAALERFWPAEAYHHDYYARKPEQGYCRAVIRPKVEKFERVFQGLLRKP